MARSQVNVQEYGQRVLKTLRLAFEHTSGPMSVQLTEDFRRDPFIVLMSCLLSLRARDSVVYPIARRLFSTVKTPSDLVSMPIEDLEKIIKSTGFYHKKAQTLHAVSRELITRFGSTVPDTLDDLLSLPGVGRKTANLVLAEGFGKPAICVDVHVHRLANQLELVKTKTPEQTEFALQKLFPKKDWRDINRYLVLLGQSPKSRVTVTVHELLSLR